MEPGQGASSLLCGDPLDNQSMADQKHSHFVVVDCPMEHTMAPFPSRKKTTWSSSVNRTVKPACLPISVVSLLIIALVFLPLFNDHELESPDKTSLIDRCTKPCRFELVESIPTGLSFKAKKNTWQEWIEIIDNTEKFLDIAAFYWYLNKTDYPTSVYGKKVFSSLIRAAQRGVKIRIAQSVTNENISDNADSQYLADNGLAEVRSLNMSALVGNGVLHTKFLISDMRAVYVGSANMDWRSLSEVKELGVSVGDCPCVASDLYRIFAVYWRLGEEGAKVPAKWPLSYKTVYNMGNPMPVPMTQNSSWGETSLFISSSPPPFSPKGRENDVNAIVKVIERANHSVCVAVMDLLPMLAYTNPNKYWSTIDVALRDAAFRGVAVRLLVSSWPSTRSATVPFLKSLVDINEALPKRKGSIQVKLFTVPSTEEQKQIPYARVNHNKYMVADSTALIGTSNWVGDYFTTTAGVSLVFNSSPIASQLQSIFERDWRSEYAKSI